MTNPVPTLMLLPGLDGTGMLFEPFLAALAGAFPVRVVSYPPAAPFGYAELQDFAEAALPVTGPFVLLGESFSGPLAIALAAKHGTRVKALILCCTFARNPHPALTRVAPALSLWPSHAVPAFMRDALLFGRFATPALRAALGRALASVSARALRARLRAVAAVDVSAHLAVVTAPVLYLRAAKDRVVPLGALAGIARVCPAVRVTVIDGPHGLLQAAPMASARAVVDFCSGLKLVVRKDLRP